MTIIKINNNAIDLNAAEIPSLDTAKIATGTFPADRINNTSLDNITSLPSGVGGTAWQAVKTSAFTAVSGQGYFVDTTSGAITVTLPASASVGDNIILVDYARTWGTNAITINQNSLNFQGATTPNPTYNTDGQSVTIVYSGATQGWIPTTDDDVTYETSPPYSVDFLVIAGGGSGGAWTGGGGGAGGYRTSTQSVNPGTVITVAVGDGGPAKGGSDSPSQGINGSNSSISGSGLTTITSTGGGGGGGFGPASVGQGNGRSGGSGGGGGTNATFGIGAGTGNTPSTSPSQGNNGGNGGTNPDIRCGGGGGAGAVGANGVSGAAGGAGGAGSASSITGSSITRAGGGGGHGDSTGGAGGTGGGGAGSSGVAGGTNATANTGSGGGGARDTPASGTGGKGVVILSIPTVNYSGTTTGSPTESTSGANKILVFNGDGSYTG